MSIAKSLAEVNPNFVQECPFCKRSNRIVMHGLWVLGKEVRQHPDMGYSFCNCRDIFYTRPENVLTPVLAEPDEHGVITYPDPFFAWPNPYDFLHWDVRKYPVLWDMDSLCDFLGEIGHEVISTKRDFDVSSSTPQHFHIKVKR